MEELFCYYGIDNVNTIHIYTLISNTYIVSGEEKWRNSEMDLFRAMQTMN